VTERIFSLVHYYCSFSVFTAEKPVLISKFRFLSCLKILAGK
jgi:hypothetical protein